MRDRYFVAVTLAASLSSAVSARAEVITEAEVVRRLRLHDPEVAAAREELSLSAAEESRTGPYPDPEFGWERETFLESGSPDEFEEAFTLSIPIDLSTARRSQRALARAETTSTRVRVIELQSEAITHALHLFYAVLAAEREVEIGQRSVTALEEATRVLARRYEEGTLSGYERSRLELETELARSSLHETMAEARRLRTELALRLGTGPDSIDLVGELRPSGEPEMRSELEAMSRSSLVIARGAIEPLHAAGRAARWSWIPTLSVTGGMRRGGAEETRYGYVAGVALSIPTFSRPRSVRAAIEARERLTRARVEAAERRTQIEVARAINDWTLASQELARFEAAVGGHVEQVERAAASAYQEGERSILEFVDAQRAWAAVQIRRLELARMARHAELRLRAACGAFE